MERDPSSYSGLGYPCFQRIIYHRAFQFFEDKSLTALTAEFQCLLRNREIGFLLGLFSAQAHHISILGLYDMIPRQLLNVADSESGQAGKQRSPFKYLMLTRRCRQFLYFIKRRNSILVSFHSILVR